MPGKEVLEKIKALREDEDANAYIDWSDIIRLACPRDMFNTLYGAAAEECEHLRNLEDYMAAADEFYGKYDPETVCEQCKTCKFCMPDLIHKHYIMPGWLYWACDRDNDGTGTAKPECVFAKGKGCKYYQEAGDDDIYKREHSGEDHDAIKRILEARK